MSSTAWGNKTDLVLAILREHGRLTEAQLVRLTGQSQRQVAATLQRLKAPSPRYGKRAYRCAWVSGHAEHKKPHLAPVWALGSLPCALRPPPVSHSLPLAAREKLRASRCLYTTTAILRESQQ